MNYYLGPVPWIADRDEPRYAPPSGTVGWIDLRRMDQISQGEVSDGIGFFATTGRLPSEYTLLATEDLREARVSSAMQSAWETLLGYRPGGDTLLDLLWNQLTYGADPMGADRCKPLMPTVGRSLELHLAGHSLVRAELFRWGASPHTNRVKAVVQADLLSMRTASSAGRMRTKTGVDVQFHRRALQAALEKYHCQYEDLRPVSWPTRETPLPHSTVITDDFNRGDQEGLGTSSEAWSWDAGTEIDIVSNRAQKGGGATVAFSRAETDLASVDHYAQIVHVNGDSIFHGDSVGVSARFSTGDVQDGSSKYYFSTRGDGAKLFKRVNTTDTELASGGTGTPSGAVCRIEVNGSDIDCYFTGVSEISTTDTSITTGTRTGINMRFTDDVPVGDSFEAGDLEEPPAPPAAPSGLQMDHRFLRPMA